MTKVDVFTACEVPHLLGWGIWPFVAAVSAACWSDGWRPGWVWMAVVGTLFGAWCCTVFFYHAYRRLYDDYIRTLPHHHRERMLYAGHKRWIGDPPEMVGRTPPRATPRPAPADPDLIERVMRP